jgi:NADPH:quinone reductase-like Zn-dependent oxidoreductase
MDNVGNAPYARIRHLLEPGGRFLMVVGDLPQMLAAAPRKNVISPNQDADAFSARYYRLLLDMAAAGQLRAVIHRSFPFEQIVEAHRLVDTGHKRGSVIVTLERPS